MASSGLFTVQEFTNRGIIKLAPDVLVYISGSLGDRIIAPVSGANQVVSFNDGITNVSIQNTIDPPGQSTASISITTPIYGENSNYWVKIEDPDAKRTRRVPYFVPMMEVRIYMKGRFLSDGQPKYYPSFWGLINTVEENYSGGLYTMNLNCVDMLHWWHWSTVNIHPVPGENIAVGGGLDLTTWSTVFKTGNPYTILYTLSTGYTTSETDPGSNMMGMALFTPPTWIGQRTSQSQSFPKEAIQAVSKKLMDYWRKRLNNLGNILKMYGVSGTEVTVKSTGNDKNRSFQLIQVSPSGRTVNSPTPSPGQAAGTEMGTRIYDYDQGYLNNLYLQDFTVFADLQKMGTFDQSEYMTKLEIATHVRDRCEFEFFQDVNGNWIFKPPFYNMNVKYTMPYVIKPIDILSSSFQIDSEGIVTSMEVKTPLCYAIKDDVPMGIGYHIDVDLAGKYGIRHRLMNAEWIASPKAANQLAMGYMALANAKTTTGTLTIPGRPELRMGYPIYIDHRDSFHYVKGISHSFDYGGSFTTSLTLEAERSRQYKDDGSIYKDYVYSFTGDIPAGTDQSWKDKNDVLAASKFYGVKQGRYDLVPRSSMATLSGNKKQVDPDAGASFKAATPLSAPFTDEDGYKVIGAFLYGRGLPYDFERVMAVVDDAAGYERESAVMGVLHKQQKRTRLPAKKNDQATATTAANSDAVNADQAQVRTAENANEQSRGPGSVHFTPGFVPTSSTPNAGPGSASSTWQYEGIILSYLDELVLDQGKDDPNPKEKSVNDSVNPAVAGDDEKSLDLLAGQTAVVSATEAGGIFSVAGTLNRQGLPPSQVNPMDFLLPSFPYRLSRPLGVLTPEQAAQWDAFEAVQRATKVQGTLSSDDAGKIAAKNENSTTVKDLVEQTGHALSRMGFVR